MHTCLNRQLHKYKSMSLSLYIFICVWWCSTCELTQAMCHLSSCIAAQIRDCWWVCKEAARVHNPQCKHASRLHCVAFPSEPPAFVFQGFVLSSANMPQSDVHYLATIACARSCHCTVITITTHTCKLPFCWCFGKRLDTYIYIWIFIFKNL